MLSEVQVGVPFDVRDGVLSMLLDLERVLAGKPGNYPVSLAMLETMA